MLATVSFALAALSAIKAAPVPVVDSSVSLPNTTQVDQTAYWYTQDGRAGACGAYSKDSDVVLGLPLEFYEKYDAVSPYCGSFVVVKGDNNKTVTALVADASTLNDTVTLSVAAWRALDGDNGLKTVDWHFANKTEAAAAEKALKDSPATSVVETPASATSAKAPTWTSYHAAATPSSSSWSSSSHAAPTTTEKKESSSSAAWTAPSSSSSAWHSSSSASSSSEWHSSSSAAAEKKVAPSSSSSAWSPEHSSSTSTWSPEHSSSTSTKEWKESSTSTYEAPKTTTTSAKPTTTTTTSQWVAPKTTTTTQAPKKTQEVSSSSASGQFSGRATFYSQGGAAGSCGNYASDSDYVVAVNAAQMNSGWCGKTVKVTNTANGKSITATVADTCPGCGYGSLDLSTGAFGAIGNYDTGVLPITWDLY